MSGWWAAGRRSATPEPPDPQSPEGLRVEALLGEVEARVERVGLLMAGLPAPRVEAVDDMATTITHGGETLTLAEWGARLGMSGAAIRQRMARSPDGGPEAWLAPKSPLQASGGGSGGGAGGPRDACDGPRRTAAPPGLRRRGSRRGAGRAAGRAAGGSVSQLAIDFEAAEQRDLQDRARAGRLLCEMPGCVRPARYVLGGRSYVEVDGERRCEGHANGELEHRLAWSRVPPWEWEEWDPMPEAAA